MRTWLAILLLVAFPSVAKATDVQEITSPGGIKAWLVQEHSLPLVAVHVAFSGSGYAYDTEGTQGRANMAASMIASGAGDMGEQALNAGLESAAIQLSASIDEDVFEAEMQFPSAQAEKAFFSIGLALAKPRYDSDAVERTRRQLLAELVQQQESPGYHLGVALKKKMFGEHPYARNQTGTEKTLRRLDSSDLSRYSERYLTRENMMIAVVGDITPDALKALLDKHFSALPAKYNPDSTVPDIAIPAGDGKPMAIDFNVPQTVVGTAVAGLKRSDPDYMAAYVMNHILGGEGGLTSRLSVEIREKRGLAYGAYSYLRPLKQSGAWSAGFATRSDQAKNALTVMLDTLDTFVKNGPTDKEMEDAKSYLTGSFALNLDSNTGIARFLINIQHNKLGIDYFDRRNKLIRAVSKSDVRAMAAKLIDTKKLHIVMVGKPETDKGPAK